MATYFRHLRLRILVALHGFTAHITLSTRVIRVVRGGTVPPEHAAGGGLRSEGVLHDDRERTPWELARRMCPSSWPISAGTAVWSGPRTGSRGCRRGPSRAAGRRCRVCMPTWSPGVTHLCRSTRCRRELLTRRQGGSVHSRTVPLVRVPRTLPRILPPQEADRLVAALCTHRDQAMVLAMLLAGLRRCEVLGLRFEDVQVADRRLAVVEGKGGHHRVVPAGLTPGRSRAAARPRACRGLQLP